MVFFLSISVVSLEPFQCITHPNGFIETMKSNYAVRCWQGGEHTTMIALAIVAILVYPVAFLAKITYASWRFNDLLLKYIS